MDVMLKFTGSGDDREDVPADMCGLIGQGMQTQIMASRPKKKGNVIIPGTLAWVKQAHREEQKLRDRQRQLKGM